uniref:Uncharacterized protein n=1 Tax=Desulfovibrio sp. U5L TaxID=596152 RepID=I2Q2M9_9BACT
MPGSRVQINPGALGQIKDLLRDAFRTEMAFVEGVAKERCPVRTGFLRDSIQVTVVQSDGGAEVDRLEVTAPYAAPVELGTPSTRAHPFLLPALTTFNLRHVADRIARTGGLRVTVSQASSIIGGEIGAELGSQVGEIVGGAAGGLLGPLGGTAGATAGRYYGGGWGRQAGARAGGHAGGVIYDRTSQKFRDIAGIISDIIAGE